jgi:endogenous inhibitor of DNA gyrase (YacG/DUF329 family)
MKIISGARQVHCDKCGCIYEFGVGDVVANYVRCPICGKKHKLVDSDGFYY